MQKDVIYIDVDDDITSIIGKVNDAKQKIVAIVPPKRIGAIQSAVNLKLVHRAAENADKRLVIISNNPALASLAASAGIPVAKNLQSKPELATISALAVDEDDDIIDGAELPVGEHAAQAEKAAVASGAEDAVPAEAAPVSPVKSTRLRDGGKVPNFNNARRKIFLIAGAVVSLIAFLVWAIFFAPSARIIITAMTSDAALSSRVTVGPNLTTDLRASTIKAETKTIKKDVSIPLTATGKKDVGERATGQVRFSQQSLSATTVPAGTELTSSGGLTFVTSAAVTIPASSFGAGCFPTACAGSANGSVTAVESGSKYNAAAGSLGGAPAGVSAAFTSPTGGGTDKVITVLQQSDVDAVIDQIEKAGQEDAAKNELKTAFKDEFIILDSSFKSDKSGVKPSPGIDQESADGKATLAGQIVYSLTATSKVETGRYLDAYFKQQIDGKSDQKIYDNGVKETTFTNISGVENGFAANIATNGKIGPKVDEARLKEFAKGKSFGEIQGEVQSVEGVESADIKFSPFWVSSAPNDINRIKVEFKVNGR